MSSLFLQLPLQTMKLLNILPMLMELFIQLMTSTNDKSEEDVIQNNKKAPDILRLRKIYLDLI